MHSVTIMQYCASDFRSSNESDLNESFDRGCITHFGHVHQMATDNYA